MKKKWKIILGIALVLAVASIIGLGLKLTVAKRQPHDAIVDADGMVWFTESAANKIGRITLAGDISEFDIPSATDYQDPALGAVSTSFPIAMAAC